MTSRPSLTLGELEKLDPESQINLIGEIWDGLAEANPSLPLSDADKKLLDDRLASEGHLPGKPADSVFADLRNRL